MYVLYSIDSSSVMDLLHFVSSLTQYLLQSQQVSCSLHQLFHLPHLQMFNCRVLNDQPDISTSDQQLVQSHVGDYFFTRFPALLISVYHLVAERWKNESLFDEFLHTNITASLPVLEPLSPTVNKSNTHTTSWFNNVNKKKTISSEKTDPPVEHGVSTALPVNMNAQMKQYVTCCYGDHVVEHPISTPCCGLSLCKQCVKPFVEKTIVRYDEKKSCTSPSNNEEKSDNDRVIGMCSCGHTLSQVDIEQLERAPINQALAAIVACMTKTSS